MNNIIKKTQELSENLKNINKLLNNDNLNIRDKFDDLLAIKNDILEFDTQCKQLSNMINICNELNHQNKELFNCNILNIKNKINNNATDKVVHKYTIDNVSIIPEINDKQFLNIPVIVVEDKETIKNTPIYYIKNIDKFAIKINNKLIMGNLGNIYNKHSENKSKVNKCYKVYCNKKNCNFYHNNRNFMNYSWIHSTSYKNSNIKKVNKDYILNNDTSNTRFLGSKDTLMNDIIYTNSNERDLRNSQLMHDILIYQILDNYLYNYKS